MLLRLYNAFAGDFSGRGKDEADTWAEIDVGLG